MVDINTELRKKAQSNFKKVSLKPMNNSVFGKTIKYVFTETLSLRQLKEEEAF